MDRFERDSPAASPVAAPLQWNLWMRNLGQPEAVFSWPGLFHPWKQESRGSSLRYCREGPSGASSTPDEFLAEGKLWKAEPSRWSRWWSRCSCISASSLSPIFISLLREVRFNNSSELFNPRLYRIEFVTFLYNWAKNLISVERVSLYPIVYELWI